MQCLLYERLLCAYSTCLVWILGNAAPVRLCDMHRLNELEQWAILGLWTLHLPLGIKEHKIKAHETQIHTRWSPKMSMQNTLPTFSAWASRLFRLLVTFFSSSSSSAHLLKAGRAFLFGEKQEKEKEQKGEEKGMKERISKEIEHVHSQWRTKLRSGQ